MNKQLSKTPVTKMNPLVMALLILGLLALCFYWISSMFVGLASNH